MSSGNLVKPETTWIGIDQSYSGFGLAVLRSDGTEETHLWKFPSKACESQRLYEIYSKLQILYIGEVYGSPAQDCVVAMEGYAHGSKFNREKLGELGGIVKLSTYLVFKRDPVIVPPTVLKKYMTGKGTASKDQMLAAAQARNTSITNHNVADAYALALYIKENHGI